jgi:hypothetical protein
MIVRTEPRRSSDGLCIRNPRSAKGPRVNSLAAKAPAEATNSRLVQTGDIFVTMRTFNSEVFIDVRLLTVSSNTKIGHQSRNDLLTTSKA